MDKNIFNFFFFEACVDRIACLADPIEASEVIELCGGVFDVNTIMNPLSGAAFLHCVFIDCLSGSDRLTPDLYTYVCDCYLLFNTNNYLPLCTNR